MISIFKVHLFPSISFFYLKFISCKQLTIVVYLPSLLIFAFHWHFSAFTYNVDINMTRFDSILLFFVYYLPHLFCFFVVFNALVDSSPVMSVAKAWKHFRIFFPVSVIVVTFPGKEKAQHPLSIITKMEVLSYLFWNLILNHQPFQQLTSAA